MRLVAAVLTAAALLLAPAAAAAERITVMHGYPGLSPGTAYRYRIAAQGEVREGVVRTQRYWNSASDAAELVIAIGSCHFIAHPSSMAARYRQARSFGPLQKLLTATAHLAILDDHDFGPNDADGSYVLKGESLKLFQRYWPNPSYGLPGVPGAFGWARIGDVDLFLLDGRTHRHPNHYPDRPEKTMFGAAQLEWLKQALLSSRARIKLIAAGSQFGLIRVSGPGSDRRIALESYDSDGGALWRHEIRAGDLRFPRERP